MVTEHSECVWWVVRQGCGHGDEVRCMVCMAPHGHWAAGLDERGCMVMNESWHANEVGSEAR